MRSALIRHSHAPCVLSKHLFAANVIIQENNDPAKRRQSAVGLANGTANGKAP